MHGPTVALAVLSLALPSSSHHPPRPSNYAAHYISHVGLDGFADLIDGHLVMGRWCVARGNHSRRCRFRITGRSPFNGEVMTRRQGNDLYARAWIRPGAH